MAIINCPSCNTRISNKAKVCSSCNFNLVGDSSSEGLNEEQIESARRRNLIKQRYSMQMQAMSGIVLVLLGSLMWYFGGRDLSNFWVIAGIFSFAAGSILYVVTRVRLLMFKRANS